MDIGRGEDRVRYGKSNIETYSTICKIDSQWEFAVWLRKLKQGLCINPEGWGGRGVSMERDICIPMDDSNCQHPLDHQKSKRVLEKHLFLLY